MILILVLWCTTEEILKSLKSRIIIHVSFFVEILNKYKSLLYKQKCEAQYKQFVVQNYDKKLLKIMMIGLKISILIICKQQNKNSKEKHAWFHVQ